MRIDNVLTLRAGVCPELSGLEQPGHGLLCVPQFPAVLGVIGIVPEGILCESLVHPADANIEIGGIAPSGPSEVQAGVQHSHQHPLAGKSGLPGAAQTHQVVAVAVGALLGEGARLFNGPVVHMLYVGAFHPVHGLDFSQTAIGDFHGHCVDQIGPLGDQLHILAHGGQQIALGLLELRLPGFGSAVGQVLADGFAGGNAGDRRAVKTSQDRLIRQGDNDGHQVLGLITRGFLPVFCRLLLFLIQPGQAGEFCRIQRPGFRVAVCGQRGGEEAHQHDCYQQ
ncbi:unknown [Firmicutes bacterium CAG:137]|nr:unknown [Firmicutes bacterium CAG:137]